MEVLSNAGFGEGSGRIWLTNVSCSGDERVLMNCSSNNGINSCTHAQDASIRCSLGKTPILVMTFQVNLARKKLILLRVH